MALTRRQQTFVNEYLVDLNATQAAVRAGYSKKTANEQGARLLAHVSVAAAIQKGMDERSARTGITADKVLQELAKLGFSDPRKVFDDNGNLLPVTKFSDDVAAAVSSIEVVTTRLPGGEATEVEHTSKIKFWDKRGSLELLGKHLKLFVDRHEHTGKDGQPVSFIIKG